jgi:hypothetical protein
MIAIVVVILMFVVPLVFAHIRTSNEDAPRNQPTNSVKKRAENATDEAWEYHLHQALHEIDLHVAGCLSPSDYQQLAMRNAFTEHYVNDYLTPIFTWGYVIGQRYSMGQTVSMEEKRVVQEKIDKLAVQLKIVMASSNDQIVSLYVNAAKNCFHKGIAAGEKQGGYVLVSR